MINTQISFVTGIRDLDRDDLSDGWKRSFEYYINNFIRLLESMKDFATSVVWVCRKKV